MQRLTANSHQEPGAAPRPAAACIAHDAGEAAPSSTTTSQSIGVEPDGRIPRDTHRCTRNILADPIVETQPWSEVCTVFTPEVLDNSGTASPVILRSGDARIPTSEG